MRIYIVVLFVILLVVACLGKSVLRKSDSPNAIKDCLAWLEEPPSFEVSYQTGYSENGVILVVADWYLKTNYKTEHIAEFSKLKDEEICELLNDSVTKTNCVLLLNEINLISNLDYENSTYEEWKLFIADEQLSFWLEKYGCK